jgi:GT2 family glycosyltransferase
MAGIMNFNTKGLINTGYLPFAGSGTMGIRKELFLQVGGFDSSLKYSENSDLCYRIQLTGSSIHFLPDTHIYVRLRNSVWDACKQSYNWGRSEKVLAIRYERFGHKNPGFEFGSLRTLLRSCVIFVLRFYDQKKRRRYARSIFKILGSLMPTMKEASMPVKINEAQLDRNVLKRLLG